RRDQLGVVRRWLGQRGGQHQWSRLDERQRPDLLGSARLRGRGKDVPFLPRLVVPVPPPAVQLLQPLRAGYGGSRDASAGRGRVPRRGETQDGGTGEPW